MYYDVIHYQEGEFNLSASTRQTLLVGIASEYIDEAARVYHKEMVLDYPQALIF